ncbi:MAG: hypothetical protein GXP55_15790 [Deltaproteobacteria bacterium]|nr:hypothetical protein [Deltaproteobacteria bacterium]
MSRNIGLAVAVILAACDGAPAVSDGAPDAAIADSGSDTAAADGAEACSGEDGLRRHGLALRGMGSARLENDPVHIALVDEAGSVLREALSPIEGGAFAVSWPCALLEGANYRLYYYVDTSGDELCCGEPSGYVDVATAEADISLELAPLGPVSYEPTACGHFANPIALEPGSYQITSTTDGRNHGQVTLLSTPAGNLLLKTFISGCSANASCAQSIRGAYGECGRPLCVGRDGTISSVMESGRRGMATIISLAGTVEDGATSARLHLTGRVSAGEGWCCSQEGDVLLERTSLDVAGCE